MGRGRKPQGDQPLTGTERQARYRARRARAPVIRYRRPAKDYRGHLKQVVLGIVLDDGDRPIASFLMPGSTADVTLLLPVVRRLSERFGVARACIIGDRGMISAATIAALEAEKIEYILGVRERTSRELRAEIIDDGGLAVPLVIPRQKGETELAVKETTIAGRRYIICRNEEEARKDAEARAELVAGLERKLAQGDKALVANKGSRRFLKTPEDGGFVITIATRSRPTPASTASSRCAPTRKSPPSRSSCATATCSPSRTPSKSQRRCSPPARFSTRPTPASAATSSAPSSPWSCARNCWIVSQRAAASSNGSALSTTSPISARSRSNRMAAGPACVPPRPDHRSDLSRYRSHPAARLPGDAAHPLNPP